jgi:hypothetical protein
MDDVKALAPEIDCDQTALGTPNLQYSYSKVIYVKRGCLGGVTEMLPLPLRGYSVSGMYVLF